MSQGLQGADNFIDGIIVLLDVYALVLGFAMAIFPKHSLSLIARRGSKEAWQLQTALWSSSRKKTYRLVGFIVFLLAFLFGLHVLRK